MTKTNEKIHVLADESLGGIKREYVEVDRKAKVGDLIVITASDYEEREEIYVAGHYGKVVVEDDRFAGEFRVDFNGVDNSFVGDDGFWYVGRSANSEYRVLEPTNIVHIDGERYEMVDRKAEVGEKVIHMDEGKSEGRVTEVTDVGVGMIDVIEYEDSDGDITCGFSHGCYRVIVPAESSEEEPQPSDPIDVIANLATRVAELERENKRIKEDLGWNEMGPGRIAELRNADSDIRHDIATLEEKVEHDHAENEEMHDHVYEEMKRMKDEIDTLHKDNRRHGEEIAQLDKGVHTQSQRHLYHQQEIERVWERMDRIESETEALKYAAKETDGKVAHLEADSDMRLFTAEEDSPIDAPLVFICRKPGRFEVYQDGKRLRGVMSVRINAKVGEFATHEIEYISGATEEERQ
ncbi:hypothetical protein MOB41_16770 [Bacillus haynesii]|uniref:hypothetical protein n=1 Tax=Bacillus haynesii TaxID=1925021 RepID=UPI0022808EE8|nr:hypothetical protein [Bacillus haynesii]MCY7780054.1 hypothetical protein [Bacillus haynesii]MEC0669665.1 hypothetical protein [Bacillus haynesii]